MKHSLSISPKKTNPNIVISDITILGKKWRELLKWRWAFDWIPFVDFALVAGSMALGEEDENSDFDIILGCKKGRMFTARAFAVFFFGALGIRRKAKHTKRESNNKFCFNHFVTENSYTLRPPYNLYWKTLYQNLVPLYGREEKVQKFFTANQWANSDSRGPTPPWARDKLKKKQHHLFRSPIEFILGSFFGAPLEYLLMRYQLKRIRKRFDLQCEVEPQKDARVHADENELELHPDTSRIDEWIWRRGGKT